MLTLMLALIRLGEIGKQILNLRKSFYSPCFGVVLPLPRLVVLTCLLITKVVLFVMQKMLP